MTTLAPLKLAYNPDVPPRLLRELEREGRRLGLPLAALEHLGQSRRLCEAFVAATRRGDLGRVRFLADAVCEAMGLPPPRRAPVKVAP